MSYAEPFHKIVVIGTVGADIFNFTINVAPSDGTPLSDVSQGLCDRIGQIFLAWWPKLTAASGPSFYSISKLTSVKVNRIGTDGKYMDPETREWVAGAPVAGGVAGNFMPQAAMAITLRTAVPRGRASRGRFYLPPLNVMAPAVFETDGRINAAARSGVTQACQALLDDINEAYAEPGIDGLGRVSVVSNIGAGTQRPVTVVSVGRVVDTIRSRRNKLGEDYQDLPLA